MKLHRLDLTGFGPFRETQTVDFDAFDADGVFLITGRTGAGKSSILDGVSFALYGAVPRYEGANGACAAIIASWVIRPKSAWSSPLARGDGASPARPSMTAPQNVGRAHDRADARAPRGACRRSVGRPGGQTPRGRDSAR